MSSAGASSEAPPAGFDWAALVSTTDAIAPAFVERTSRMGEWIDSSILFSDGLCFCAMCELLQVDYVIEAGTGFGGSTEMFARYFADGGRVRHIWSVDRAATPWEQLLARLRLSESARYVWSSRRRARAVAAARLRTFPQVTLIHGDAFGEVPPMVTRMTREPARIGVLIDGPKEGPQLKLAEQLLALSPNVCFVAIDDIGPKYDADGRHRRFRRSPYAVFSTSDRAYFERYSWVNAGRLPAFMIRNPASTGYGLGILVNRPT